MRMAMVLVVSMGMSMSHRLMQVLMLVMLGQMQPHAQAPSTAPARTSCTVTGSPSAITAATAPMNGAVEKYAPVRAVPR